MSRPERDERGIHPNVPFTSCFATTSPFWQASRARRRPCPKRPSANTPSRSLENDGLESLLPEPSSNTIGGLHATYGGLTKGRSSPKRRDSIGLVTGSRLDPPRIEEGTLWLRRPLRGGSSRFFPPEPMAPECERTEKGFAGTGNSRNRLL